MTKTILLLALFLMTSSPAAHPPQQVWTGEIGDSHCRFEHEPLAEGDAVLPSSECVKLCVKSGYKYVLIVDDKLYVVANQDNPELAKFPGQTVKLTGALTDNVITVFKVEASGGGT